MPRTRQKHAQYHSLLRAALFTCALIGAALLGGWLWVKSHVNDEIRRSIERRFAECYPDLHVTVRAARFIESHGIEVQGVSIARRDDGGLLAHIDELFAACPIDTAQLIAEQSPQPQRLVVRGLTVWAERSRDGKWNLARLWPLPKLGDGRCPPVAVENASVVISDLSRQPAGTFSMRNVNLRIALDERMAISDRSAAPAWKREYQLQGSLAADHCDRLEFNAVVDPDRGTWSAGGKAAGVRFTRQLLDDLPIRGLPIANAETLSWAAGASGNLQLQFSLAGDASKAETAATASTRPSCRFAVRGQLEHGQVVDPRLPYRIHEVRAGFYCDNQRLRIENLTARSGNAAIELTLDRRGLSAASPMTVQAKFTQLAIDPRVAESLPSELRLLWDRFQPQGTIDAEITAGFDGRRWSPQFDIRCRDLALAYFKFPYRIERTQGLVSLRDGVLSLDLQASAGGQAVAIRGLIEQPGTKNLGWIEIRGDRPIAIDDNLIGAIVDPKGQAVVRSLNVRGAVKINGRFERDDVRQTGFRKCVTLEIVGGSIRYEKFAYPIDAITGTVIWDDEGWKFPKLIGRNDSGTIECSGSWRPAAPTADGQLAGSQLALDITGTQIPLEDELREALSPRAQKIWRDLRPSGSIDLLNVGVRYQSAARQLGVTVQAQQWSESSSSASRSLSILPVWIPYRLDDATGMFVYRDGLIELSRVTARHGKTVFRIDGNCRSESDGRWLVDLPRVAADRVEVDRELLEGLPKLMGASLERLSPRGPMSLVGALRLAGDAHADAPPSASWDVQIDMENGSVQCGVPLNHVHGTVRLTGGRDANGFLSRGELSIDSLMVKDFQITNLRGPFMLDEAGVILGGEAERQLRDRAPRSLTAQFCGGTLSLDAGVRAAGTGVFLIDARLERGDLQQLARETQRSGQVTGKANARLTLRGDRQGPHTWRGQGFVRLFDAEIYEVPVLLQMLKLLSIRQPDKTAFTSSDLDFRIHGDHMYLDRVNFTGDAVSLRGHGEVNLRGQFSDLPPAAKPPPQLDLKFYALVGRDDFRIPGITDLLKQASQQFLLIRVTGTPDQPELVQEPLPALKETLEQIFPEVAAGNRADRQ